MMVMMTMIAFFLVSVLGTNMPANGQDRALNVENEIIFGFDVRFVSILLIG